MATSQNGWPVLTGGSHMLHDWKMPDIDRHLTLRQGSAGFLLIHNAVYFDRYVERLDRIGSVWDEWGHAVRPVRGQTSGYSNHAAGCACDLNSTLHPRGVSIHHTFTPHQIDLIHNRLKMYHGAVRWGGDYQNSPPDGMHFEIVLPLPEVEKTAKRLINTKIGKEILAVNPGQRKVILS